MKKSYITGKNHDFYDLGKKMFDRLNPHIAHNPKVVGPVQEPVAEYQVRDLLDTRWCNVGEGIYNEVLASEGASNVRKLYTKPPSPSPVPCITCAAIHVILDADESMIIRNAKDGYPEGRTPRELTLVERVVSLCKYAADWKRWCIEAQATPPSPSIGGEVKGFTFDPTQETIADAAKRFAATTPQPPTAEPGQPSEGKPS